MAKDFSDLNQILATQQQAQNNSNTPLPTEQTPEQQASLSEQQIRLAEEISRTNPGVDLSAQEGFSSKIYDQSDIYMTNSEKLGKSLVAGTGDVLEQFNDLAEITYNYLTPFGYIERSQGLDFSKNFFDWVEENTAGKLQEQAVKYRGELDGNLEWKDFGNADFWTTDIARVVPNLLTMIGGGVGLARGAGNLLVRAASKKLLKEGAEALGKQTVSKFNKGLVYKGGLKNLGFTKGAFRKTTKGLELSRKGKMVANVAAGAGMNLVEGGIIAGMAYDKAIEETKDRNLAGQVAADLFIDNSKWLLIDALSWSFTFGGGSKMLMSKVKNSLSSIQSGIGGRLASTFAKPARFSVTAVPEGIEEMFQETYQEWIEEKAFNEMRGETEKTPKYWDFFTSDKARRTKMVSLVSGIAGGSIGGYTNLVNDIAQREYEADKRIESVMSIINRYQDAETTAEKTEALYDMANQAVMDENGQALVNWMQEEVTKDKSAVDEKLVEEISSFVDLQTEAYNKIGKGLNINTTERQLLFQYQVAKSKTQGEKLALVEQHENDIKELEEEKNNIDQSDLSIEQKNEAKSNIDEQITQLQDDHNENLDNIAEIEATLQAEINGYTEKVLENSKNRKLSAKDVVKTGAKILKSIVKSPFTIVNSIEKGIQAAKQTVATKTEGESSLESISKQYASATLDEMKKDSALKKQLDQFKDEELLSVIEESFAASNYDFATENDKQSAKFKEVLSDNISKLAESKLQEQSKNVKETPGVLGRVKKFFTGTKTETKPVTPEKKTTEEKVSQTEQEKKIKEEIEGISTEQSIEEKFGITKELSPIQKGKLNRYNEQLENAETEEQKSEAQKQLDEYVAKINTPSKSRKTAEEITPDLPTTASPTKKRLSFFQKLNPIIMVQNKIKKNRLKKEAKQQLAILKEKRRKQSMHYVYAMKDANYPDKAIIPMALVENIFGREELGKTIGNVMYAKLGKEFYNTVKHELGHILWETFEGEPLMNKIIETIIGDKETYKNIEELYPENRLYAHIYGSSNTILEVVSNESVRNILIEKNPDLDNLIKTAIEKHNARQPYEAEALELQKEVKKVYGIFQLPKEEQTLILEEVFTSIIDSSDDITLDKMLGSNEKTKKDVRRRFGILFDKLKGGETSDANKLNLLKSVDDQMNNIESLEDAFAIIKQRATDSKKVNKLYRNSRTRSRKNRSIKPTLLSQKQIKLKVANERAAQFIADNLEDFNFGVDFFINPEYNPDLNKENFTETVSKFIDGLIADDTDVPISEYTFTNFLDSVKGTILTANELKQAIAKQFILKTINRGRLLSDTKSPVLNTLKDLFLIDNESLTINKEVFKDESLIADALKQGDNPLARNEINASNKILDNFILFLNTPEGINLSKKAEFAFDNTRASKYKDSLRKTFARTIINLDRNSDKSFDSFYEKMITSNDPLIKSLVLYLEPNDITNLDFDFAIDFFKGIYHTYGSQISEKRDVLYIDQQGNPLGYEDALSQWEQSQITIYTSNTANALFSFDQNYLTSKNTSLYTILTDFDNSDLITRKIDSQGREIPLGDTFDLFKLKTVKTVNIDGKIMSTDEFMANRETFEVDEISEVLKSALQESRDWNQVTLVNTARVNAKTSLLNKKSHVYQMMNVIEKLHGNEASNVDITKEVRNLWENSVFEYLSRQGITPKLSFDAGIGIKSIEIDAETGDVAEINEYGQTYFNLTADEVTANDILRYVIDDNNTYQASYFVIAEKSRRPNVTVPKFKSLFGKAIKEETDAILKVAEEIQKAKYKEGGKVSNIIEVNRKAKGIKNQLVSTPKAKEALNKVVDRTINFIEKSPSIFKDFIENGSIKGVVNDDGTIKVSRQWVESFELNHLINRFSAQQLLIGDHKNFKDHNDYSKRSPMSIARKGNQLAPEIELIIMPDFYLNSKDGTIIDSKEYKKLGEPKDYKIINDGQSHITAEDKFNYDYKTGFEFEGSTLKTVGTGRDLRENGIDSGDLYVKHNTTVFDMNLIKDAVDSGDLIMAKYYAYVKERQKHIKNKYGKHVPILVMSESAVKSDKNNKTVEVLDIRNVKLNKGLVIDTFRKTPKIHIAINNESINNAISSDSINEKRDKTFAPDQEYLGFDGNILGVQSVLESNKNQSSSNVLVQMISNIQQNVSQDNELKSLSDNALNALFDASANQLDAIEEKILDIKEGKTEAVKEFVDFNWAGYPFMELIDKGFINIPEVESKIREVVSKAFIFNGSKLRGPGGIAFEGSPIGVNLKSRVKLSEISYSKDSGYRSDLIVSEVILPDGMSSKFKKGDVLLGSRVPADSPRHHQVFVVKGFGSKEAGQVTLLPPDISSIMGSDKDADAIFFNGKFKKVENSKGEIVDRLVNFNDFINNSINLFGNPKMDSTMSLSLENIDNFAEDIFEKMNEQRDLNDEALSLMFDNFSMKNNIEMRKILGVVATAIRDTNKLARYGTKLNMSLSAGSGRILNVIEDKANENGDFDFANNVANLFNLILDNAAKQRAFTMGVNQTVARDMVIMLRMGFTPTEVFNWANSDVMTLTYIYDERSTLLPKNRETSKKYTPDFLAYLHIVKSKGDVDFGVNILNVLTPQEIEQERSVYNRITSPKVDAAQSKAIVKEVKTSSLNSFSNKKIPSFARNLNPGAFETGQLSLSDRLKSIKSISILNDSKFTDSLKAFKLMRNVKSDIDSYSGLVNIYKSYPKNIMEAQSLIYDFDSAMERQKGLIISESFKNDPHLLMLKNTVDEYIKSFGFTYSSTEKLSELTDSLVKVLNLNKYNRGQLVFEKLLNDVTDNSITSIQTKLDENQINIINDSLFSFIKNYDSDLRILEYDRRTKKVSLNIDLINDDTDSPQLNQLKEFSNEFFEEKIDIPDFGEITVAEAILMIEYNRMSSFENGKNRFKHSRKLLSVVPDKYIKSINEDLKNKSNNAVNTDTDYLLNIFNDNKNIVSRIYQNIINAETDISYSESDGLVISGNKYNSYKPLINAIMKLEGENYIVDETKVEKILNTGVKIFPVLNNNTQELYYIDLESLNDNKGPEDFFKKFTPTEETINQTNIETSKTKVLKGTKGKSRKVIRDSDLKSYTKLDSKNDADVRKYMDMRGMSSLTNNPQVRLDAEKSMTTMQAAIDGPIKTFLENYFPFLNNYTAEQLMDMAHSYSSAEIEPLAKQLIVKEISIALANVARDEQIALNPEGYSGATEGDVSGIKKWLMSNDVDTNNPDVQYMTSIVEKEYFKYTQEYTKQARPIKVLAKSLKSEAVKQLGLLEYVKKWLTGDLNRYMYRNIYDIKTNEAGQEYIELKRSTDGMTAAESEFHGEFVRIMEETHNNYDFTIPYHTMNSHEALNRRGLYGMYMMSEGLESRLDSVPVYAPDPITGRSIKRTYAEWKSLYEDKRVNKNSFKNIKTMSQIRKDAERFFDKGFDEDGLPIKYSETSLRMLMGEEQALHHVSGDKAKLPEFASWDLESIALKTLRTNIFNNGTENFAGFKRLGVLIDGILEYNENNPNIREWVDTIYKDYILQGKKRTSALGATADSVLDKFVLFTTLKVLGPWNLAIPVGNVLIGKFNQLRASGLKKFVIGETRFIDPTNFKKNAAIIRNYVGYDMSMFEDFYTMQEKTPFDKIADIVMMPMEYSEKYIQGSGFLGYLTKEEYDSIEVDENGSVSGLTESRVQEINELVRKEQGKGYNVTNRRLMGMYATLRLLFQFNKYLPTLVVERFGKERVNRLGEYQIGSWTAARKAYGGLLTGELTYEEFDNLPAHVKDGTRKFKNGLVLSLIISLLADWDDDNEVLNKMNNDVAMLRDTDKYKYRILPAAYWNIKSMLN